ncbi:MAG: hypothetical protein RLZZ215_3159, partial [Pseudomonadota bacterium]
KAVLKATINNFALKFIMLPFVKWFIDGAILGELRECTNQVF